MVDLLYQSIQDYYKTLSVFGYKDYQSVYKLITILCIYKHLNKYITAHLTEQDYRLINELLYKYLGTTCLLPYPNVCNDMSVFFVDPVKTMKVQLEDLRLKLESTMETVEDIKETKVVKAQDINTEETK